MTNRERKYHELKKWKNLVQYIFIENWRPMAEAAPSFKEIQIMYYLQLVKNKKDTGLKDTIFMPLPLPEFANQIISEIND